MSRVSIALFVLVAAPAHVFALAGSLDAPGIASRPGAKTDAVMKALRHERHEFVGGSFVNWFTTMYYRGDTKALGLFLDDLSKIEGVRLHVSFKKETGGARNLEKDLGGCQYMVSHTPEGKGHSFHVTVFLGDGRIDLEELYLPDVHGRAPEASDETEEREQRAEPKADTADE